jgi:hypothetical protein
VCRRSFKSGLKAIRATKPKLKEGKGREIFPNFNLLNTIFCLSGSGFVDNLFEIVQMGNLFNHPFVFLVI